MPLFRTALVERSAYREMFLNGQPPTVTEAGKGAGVEVLSLLAEISRHHRRRMHRHQEGRLTMRLERKPFMPVSNDVDDDRLEQLAREKGVGKFEAPVRRAGAGEGRCRQPR